MKVRFFNINWDTDGQEVDLPKEVILEDGDRDISIEGADELSDKYGWCVEGFDFEILKPELPSPKAVASQQFVYDLFELALETSAYYARETSAYYARIETKYVLEDFRQRVSRHFEEK